MELSQLLDNTEPGDDNSTLMVVDIPEPAEDDDCSVMVDTMEPAGDDDSILVIDTVLVSLTRLRVMRETDAMNVMCVEKDEGAWVRPFRLFEDDEEEEEDEDDADSQQPLQQNMSLNELRRELLFWFTKSRTSERKASSLLQLLRRADSRSIFALLPADVRSLRTKSNVEFECKSMPPGEFAYIGIALNTINVVYRDLNILQLLIFPH